MATAVLSFALYPTASAVDATTSSVLVKAKAAILKRTAVHLELTKTSASSTTETIISDSGTKVGTQTITAGKATAAIRVGATYAYVSGNSSGLTTILGLSSAEAKKVGKNWISLKAGTTPYADFKSDVTVSSVTEELPTAKGTKLSTAVIKSAKVFVLTWTTAGTSSTPKVSNTLTVSAVGATLPIEEVATTSSSKETIRYSKWDERVSVSAPPAGSTVTYSKIFG
jgi:hypothetical protein